MRWSALALLILTPIAQAEMYRWTDENGRVHFSDRPAHDDAEQIEQRGPKKIGQGDEIQLINERLDRLRSSEAEVSAREQAIAAQQQKDKEALRKQCAKQRYRANQYQTRIAYRIDDDGNRKYYNKQEAEQKIAEINAWIEKNCRD